MPHFRTGTVTEVLSERPGLQRVTVDGERAYVLTELVGAVAAGDRVVLNTTAVDLGLGSGGWHVVHWNLSRTEWQGGGRGHVLKLRYTSLQADVGAAEEDGGDALPGGIDGIPVVACDLHSQVGPVAAGFAAAAPGRRLVFVMTDAAALPLALSDLVHDLRGRDLLAGTITTGNAFGGDLEAVNVASALVLARARSHADAVVVGPGPGAVGTASPLGFGGLEVAGVLDTAERLGGRPVVAVRWSGADPRPRHRGVSHHTRASLAHAHCTPLVPYPRGEDDPGPGLTGRPGTAVAVPDLDLPYTSMGRTPADDPGFFRWAAAAGLAAGALARGDRARP